MRYSYADAVSGHRRSRSSARENTIFVLNHFSHNGDQMIREDLEPLAREHSFLVSYDGMTVEF